MNFRDPFATAQSNAVAYDMGMRAYMLKIYNYMASALALTGVVAMIFAHLAIATDPTTGHQALTELGQTIFLSKLRWVVAFAPLGLVIWLGMGINRLSTTAAQAIFWAYSALMGVSLSSILVVYTGESVARVFFITAGTFGAMSLYGYTTKKDLTGMGSFLMMGLWGLLIASVVNIFLGSQPMQFALSVIGVLIFVGLTAYDTQKLKSIYYQVSGSADAMAKASIMGALNLYMDFINIFIYLLRFFGDRR